MPHITKKPAVRKVAVVGNAATTNKQAAINTGNIMHGAAARNLLDNYENMPNRPWTKAEVERISSQCSHIVFVAANGIRPGAPDDHRFTVSQQRLADNIKRTDLPVVVFGLGVQHRLRSIPEKRVPKATRNLLEILSERSVNIGVRGHFTAQFLWDIGIKNTSTIGCQSGFYNIDPNFKSPAINPDTISKVAFNYTAPAKEGKILSMAIRNGYSLFGQEEFAEAAILDGDYLPFENNPRLRRFFRLSGISTSEYIAWIKQHFHQFYDMPSWFDKIGEFDFSFGTRFHGNMAALHAGVPALWIAHDTRTVELCDYMALPYVMLAKAAKAKHLDDLLAQVDYGPFERAYGNNYARLFDYVEKSGMAHCMAPPLTSRLIKPRVKTRL